MFRSSALTSFGWNSTIVFDRALVGVRLLVLSAKGAKCNSLGQRPRWTIAGFVALKARNDLDPLTKQLFSVGGGCISRLQRS